MGRQKTRGVFCRWGVIKGKAMFWKQSIKSNSVILHFSNMDNEFMEERGRFLNSLSNVPPPPFRVGDIIFRQPSEREIYLKQIEPWEQSWLLGYGSVNQYIYRKQYWEANDLDDTRLEEYEMYRYGKREKVFLKWRETADGVGELRKNARRM